MKKNKKTVMSFILSLVLIVAFCTTAYATNTNTDSISNDKIILTITIGNEKGQIGCSENMIGGGEGPEAFTVTEDGSIYIVDNINKRVNVYYNGNYMKDYKIPYIAYVRSVVVSKEMVYLLDYDAGIIYKTDLEGNLVQEIFIPKDMEKHLMLKLYKDKEGRVWLLDCENNSFLVNELNSDQITVFTGFSKDGIDIYDISKMEAKSALISSKNSEIEITTDEMLGGLEVLNIDNNGCLYISMFEQIKTSIVCGEFTVKKYQNSKCIGIAPIDIEGYYFMPNNILEVTDNGDLYQIKCTKNQIQILKKKFLSTDVFQSNISEIKEEMLEEQAIEDQNEVLIKATKANAPNNMSTTMDNAIDMCLLYWTYTTNNDNNPNPSTISTPDYLVSVSKPSTQRGIPYCWGGFDGLSTSSSSSWTNFSGAMSYGAFAGNDNCSGYYKSGTAGLDCSGFVSSAAGFASKLNTTSLASSTYTTDISDPSTRELYDIYVKSGSHVLFYVGQYGSGIYSREATTSGDEKTKLYTRSATYLASFDLRRFNGW